MAETMPFGVETAIWLALGVVLIVLLVKRRKRGARSTRSLLSVFRLGRFRPWDHDAELVKLCHGDKAMAERLIRHELERAPNMSRPGAALAAATRLRHDKRR